ncbi:MAG: glycosyl-transferase for dystroglycan-domain-containing protein [Monoraphidium minutum]|nr:MAG: glycosyl-transferase for dystroglycan-domain-containing protein [Monoraphidium minutum]
MRSRTQLTWGMWMVTLWAACLAAAVRPAASAAAEPLPQALVSCINDGAEDQYTTYKDFAYKKPVRLKLRKGWWSAKPAAAPVTVVCGLNPDRLNQLESQCRRWHGPISASVYAVVRAAKAGELLAAEQAQRLEEAEANVAAFHAKMDALEAGCQLDVLLLYEVVLDDVMEVMFPVNALRNFALLQARTELVSMVDVDLLVSNSLFDWLQTEANMKLLRDGTAKKQVYVLPAFETAPHANETEAHALADGASGMSKAKLSELVQKRVVYQFALYLFWQGHNSTDYKKWFATSTPYPIKWHDGYEPWFIIGRHANPFYDESFRGYGWNKVTHVANILKQRYEFVAHPAGFLIHRQHGRSAADKMYQAQKVAYEADVKANKITRDKPNNNLAGLTHRFRDDVYAALDKGGYEPLLDGGIKACLRVLPWWKELQQGGQPPGDPQQREQQQQQQQAAGETQQQQEAPEGDGAPGGGARRSRLRRLAEELARRLMVRRRRRA